METLEKFFHLSFSPPIWPPIPVSSTLLEEEEKSSPSPQPEPTDPILTQRALATVEVFLQASGCPEYAKTAWLHLKKAILELSTTPSSLASSAQDEILKRLLAIEKKLAGPPLTLPKPSTYANLAHLALVHSVHEKPIPSRALKEVTVKIIGQPKPSQTSERLVESINTARSSMAGKVLAAQKLQSGEILVIADCLETKKLMQQENSLTKVIAGRAKVKG